MIELADLLDFVGLEATGADFYALDRAIDLSFHSKEVGLPSPAGPVLGVTHLISKDGVFSANIAFPRHDFHPSDRIPVRPL